MAPTRIFFTILSLIFSVLVICKVRKRRFFEKDSFMWLIGCFCYAYFGAISNYSYKICKYNWH